MMTRRRGFISIFAIAVSVMLFGCGKQVGDSMKNGDRTQNDVPNTIGTDNLKEEPPISFGGRENRFSIKDEQYENHSKSDCMLEPILQNPTEDSVTVMWFTKEAGEKHSVLLYEEDESDSNPSRVIEASTTELSRVRGGMSDSDKNDPTIRTKIYKHVALVDGLPLYRGNANERVAYRIESDKEQSGMYTLAAKPQPGTALTVLLTSDLQSKKMTAANLQKVFETVGYVDAVFLDGDLVDVPDRAYDWFYEGNAFFRIFTGTADSEVEGQTYYGAPLLQQAPIYTAIGNHDVMGVYDEKTDLSVQFNYPSTIEHAKTLFDMVDTTATEEDFVRDNSFNTITYEEIFELPQSNEGGEKYYAASFGDIGLITLETARVWRQPALGIPGKYSEFPGTDSMSGIWGFGDFIFEPVNEGSAQIQFLKDAVNASEYKDAKYRVAMFHNEAHSLGGNQIPAFTDPVASEVVDPVSGQTMTVYDYPIEKDYIHGVIEPILEKSGTGLLLEAHSHIWNRFVTEQGMQVLETSNVGNNYGGFYGDTTRSDYPSALKDGDSYADISDAFHAENYVLSGDPYGLEPVEPTKAPLPGNLPYLASDTITAFSVLNTEDGTVKSYYFDTENTGEGVICFDEFNL